MTGRVGVILRLLTHLSWTWTRGPEDQAQMGWWLGHLHETSLWLGVIPACQSGPRRVIPRESIREQALHEIHAETTCILGPSLGSRTASPPLYSLAKATLSLPRCNGRRHRPSFSEGWQDHITEEHGKWLCILLWPSLEHSASHESLLPKLTLNILWGK